MTGRQGPGVKKRPQGEERGLTTHHRTQRRPIQKSSSKVAFTVRVQKKDEPQKNPSRSEKGGSWVEKKGRRGKSQPGGNLNEQQF